MGRGVYFTSDWNEAAEYAMEKQEVDDIDMVDDSKIYECFVNVRDDNNITHSRFSREDIEILVTNPTQIKSATDNIGTFEPTNPDIIQRYGAKLSTGTAGRKDMKTELPFQKHLINHYITPPICTTGPLGQRGRMLESSLTEEMKGRNIGYLHVSINLMQMKHS